MNLKTLILILLYLSSCSSSDKYRDKNTKLSIKRTPSSWSSLEPDRSDIALINYKTNTIIYINSTCKKYQNSALKDLFFNLISGAREIAITEENIVKVANRDGLNINASMKIDGVKVFISSTIFKKNRCIYDFILISTSLELRNHDIKDFNLIIQEMSY